MGLSFGVLPMISFAADLTDKKQRELGMLFSD